MSVEDREPLDGHHAPIDHITAKFPTEIVCHIFEDYVNSCHLNPVNYRLKTKLQNSAPTFFDSIHRSGPLRLGAVSKRWRQIAWSHSPLWTMLHVNLTCKFYGHGPSLVLEWLERSGTLPLSIRLADYLDICSVEKRSRRISPIDTGKKIVEVINQFASRWRYLDFGDIPVDISRQLNDSHVRALQHPSLLKRISLGGVIFDDSLFPHNVAPPKSYRIHYPTHLSLILHLPSKISQLTLRLSWLTDVYIESLSAVKCHYFLRQLAHARAPLEHLAFVNIYSPESNERWTPCICEFPRVIGLSFNEEWTGRQWFEELLNTLTLPALRSLEYYGDGKGSGESFSSTAICSLLDRSGCSLQRLTLINPSGSTTQNDLEEVLNSVPSLQSLDITLHSYEVSEWLLNRFADESQRLSFLPALANLKVARPTPDLKHPSAFVATDESSPADSGISSTSMSGRTGMLFSLADVDWLSPDY